MFAGKKPAAPQAQGLGEKQTIPARHGTATFVPKGHTIRIINTYGRQVVDTWAFALGTPPEDDDDEDEKLPANGEATEAVEPSVEDVKVGVEEAGAGNAMEDAGDGNEGAAEDAPEDVKETVKEGEEPSSAAEGVKDDAPEQAGKTTEKVTEKVDGDGQKRKWSSFVPTFRRTKDGEEAMEKKDGEGEEKTDAATEATETAKDTTDGAQKAAGDAAKKSGWSAYVPTIPSVRSSRLKKPKEQRTWSSYLPSGQGFSGYNTAKSSISAFMAQHQRDPTKSVAEQMYDFSKTPVGAASLSGIASVATGSGYAGSLYAAYKAYDQVDAAATQPMEYMSMQHSHASTLHLSPRVGDTMVSNLRAPIMTLIEDTSTGVHDTLIAACDPQRYKELGVEKWAEHGSCAENLVFALTEMNEKSGLKGQKAIGRDVTVNMVPSPLNLFMNIPWTQEGEVSFEAPKCKRGDFVKFRAERDLVVVMSACPQDVLSINGGKPMVAHFVVESGSDEDRKAAEEKDRGAWAIIERARLRTEAEKSKTAPKATPKAAPRKLSTGDAPKAGAQPAKPKAEAPKKLPTGDAQNKTDRARSTTTPAPPKTEKTQRTPSVPAAKAPNGASPQPVKRKPKKLERRRTPTTTPTAKS